MEELKAAIILEEKKDDDVWVTQFGWGTALRAGFDSRWGHWDFSLPCRYGRSMALGSTQPLTEMTEMKG